jgi:hypothetical protein
MEGQKNKVVLGIDFIYTIINIGTPAYLIASLNTIF